MVSLESQPICVHGFGHGAEIINGVSWQHTAGLLPADDLRTLGISTLGKAYMKKEKHFPKSPF